MRLSYLTQIGDLTLFLKLQAWHKRSVRTEGYSARVIPTCLFVTFLDYDNIVDERLTEELRFIQDEFDIGNFYIFRSSELGRHCVCIDALTLKEVKQILNLSTCDVAFKNSPRISEYRTWVLRHGKKGDREAPKYTYTVESQYEGDNLQSVGHKMFLEAMFGVKTPELKNPLGDEAVELQWYNTWSRVSRAELEKEITEASKKERGV
jgi:hypothetical protein